MQGQRSSSSIEPFPDPFGFEPGSDNPDPFSSLWAEPENEIPDPFSSIWSEPGNESPDPVNAVNSLSLQTPPSLTQSTQNHPLIGFGLEDENETRPGNFERTTRLACKRKNIEIGSTSSNNGASSSSSSSSAYNNNLYQNVNPNSNPNPNLVGANLMPVPVNYMSVPGLSDPSDDPFPGFVTQLSQNGNGTATGTSSQRSFRIRTGPAGGAIMANYNNNINLGHSVLPPPSLWPTSNNNSNNDFMINNNDNNNRRRFSLWGPPNNNNNNSNNDESANQNVTAQHVFPPLPPILEPSIPGFGPIPTVHRFPRNSRIGTSASSPIDLESGFSSDFLSPVGMRRESGGSGNWDEERERVVRAGPASSAASVSPPPGMGPTWNPASRHHHHRNFAEEIGGAAASGRMSGPPGLRSHHQHHHSHQGPPRLRPAFLLDRSGSGGPSDVWGVPLALRSREGRRIIEIRNALEMMRRGDNLRFENIYYGGIEMHDRHREMRLDIDNMSYEELLALEERIGNVNTGLNEESIKKLLKQFKYTSINFDTYEEPCCICQEEYNEGEDLGRLDCGHDFHSPCIKQWLLHKNLCPICKSTALIP
ncbi:hypothetical protein LUZ60_002628 [Juncus effusus]|nr:hypothetical protein LUZ60_002628 [Juncus effusus]